MAPSTAPVSNVIDRRIGAGFAGEIDPTNNATVDNIRLDPDDAPGAFGVPLVPVAGAVGTVFRKFLAGDDGSSIKGFLTRDETLIKESDGAPKKDAIHGRIIRGGLSVVCSIGDPVREEPVYVRTVADAPKAVGDIEATEAAGENVEIPNVVWALDGKDANGICRIRIAQ